MTAPIQNALLVVGTDTDVGKTVVTSALAAYWLRHHPPETLGLMKPVQSGTGDCELYTRLFDLGQTPAEITPQRFSAAIAPPLAAAQENRTVDLAAVWAVLNPLLTQRKFVLVEGLGGLGSPVTAEWTVADLAAAWGLPVLLVVPVKLGAIAQAVANIALARQQKLTVRGIVLNCVSADAMASLDNWAPPPLITALTQTPVLGVMPWLRDRQDLDALTTAASNLELSALGF